ncbi:UNVERIFIED_CONTAM: hypothetical protein HDU68_005262 [Siphonaria sp. JEL0065]|nr:hypothetical protein HDU68_005262 [Siphonaria sp. JEL0065]
MEILALGIGVSVGGVLLVILVALIHKIIVPYSESKKPNDLAMLPNVQVDTISDLSSDNGYEEEVAPTPEPILIVRKPRNSLYHVYEGGSDSFLTADIAEESRFEHIKALIRQLSVSRKNGVKTSN